MRSLLIAGLMFMAGGADAGVLDLFSSKAVSYVKDRAQETKLAYTYNFDYTNGMALYLPVLPELNSNKWDWLQGELGLGYHLQEGGQDSPFMNLGFNMIPIADKVLSSMPLLEIRRIPLPENIWVTIYANLYTGRTPWVIGRDMGATITAEIFSFGK